MNTKIVLTALSLATFTATTATPTFAQKYAEQVQLPDGIRFVKNGGSIIGADPDIRVRFELLRDASTYAGTN
jgi:hypothetical protein